MGRSSFLWMVFFTLFTLCQIFAAQQTDRIRDIISFYPDLYDSVSNPEEQNDDDSLFEGDMMTESDFFARNAVRDPEKLWPDATVPFIIDEAARFNSEEMGYINEAFREFETKTCIRWVRRTNEPAYVHIKRLGGCYSWVGRVNKTQPQDLSISTACFRNKKGSIMHEMMHAVGFHHEQSRADRDDYVTVMWEDMRKGKERNFLKYTLAEIQHLGSPYDYGSIMHYSTHSFTEAGKPTIVPRQAGVKIGQRLEFSAVDVFKLNALYNCSEKGVHVTLPVWTPEPSGGYPTVVPPGANLKRVCDERRILNEWSCDFNSGFCGTCNDPDVDMDWNRQSGKTPSPGTGPESDRNNVTGFYMYLEASNGRLGSTARLKTPPIQMTGEFCIDFWYNMNGRGMGSLQVLMGMVDSADGITPTSDELQIWRLAGDQGKEWGNTLIPRRFPMRSSFHLIFQATKGADFLGDMAIDDIAVMPGSCPERKATGPPPCACIPPFVTAWTCDFTRDTCDMMRGTGLKFIRRRVRTLTSRTGPKKDHTSGKGYYIYAEATGKTGKTYEIMTPTFPPAKICLSFWYHAYGENMGELRVFTAGTNQKLVFNISGDQGNQWLKFQQQIQITEPKAILFQAKIGNGFRSDIAIDDIVVSPGVCGATTAATTTTSTTIATTPATTTNQITSTTETPTTTTTETPVTTTAPTSTISTRTSSKTKKPTTQQTTATTFHECPPNSFRSSCVKPCPETCEMFPRAYRNMNCSEHCRPGCACRKGFVLSSTGECVRRLSCPPDLTDALEFACGFETHDLCGMQQSRNDSQEWKIATSAAYDGVAGATVVPRPRSRSRPFAIMRTPRRPISADSGCLKFAHKAGRGSILVVSTVRNNRVISLWLNIGSDSDQWRFTQIDIPSDRVGVVQIEFEAILGHEGSAHVSLDVIQVFHSKCSRVNQHHT